MGFIIIILAVIFFICLIINHGGLILKIILHLAGGWILLFLVNLTGINIPVNLLTIAISGFGGIPGTLLLVLIKLFL